MTIERATLALVEFHYDGGHGWMRVPLELIGDERSQISEHSYIDSEFAYLEEDCDAPLWMLDVPMSISWHPPEVNDGDHSPIRDKARFTVERLEAALVSRLIGDTAKALERFGDDELERFTEAVRRAP
jgi:hypothetical protein